MLRSRDFAGFSRVRRLALGLRWAEHEEEDPMQRTAPLTASLVLASALVGCTAATTEAPDERVGAASEALELQSSFRVLGFLVDALGIGLNGTSMNGAALDGHSVVHAKLVGGKRGAVALAEASLDGSELVGRLADGKHLRGAAFEGVELPGVLEDGSTLPLTLVGVVRTSSQADRDVWRVQVTYPTQDGPRPLCGVGADGQPIAAIPLVGRPDTNIGAPGGGGWVDDPTTVTFSCDGHALAKCVDLGYKPWREGKICTPGAGCRTVSLADHHEACVRMLRADFCGDGTSHTVDGVTIGLHDAFGIRVDGTSWPVEAEWTAAGARCAVHPRVASLALPACWAALQDPSCGDAARFASGTLIMSESAP
jgi:hypothetical protein